MTDTCNHTKANGLPCGSPSLTGSPLCYFHGRALDRALPKPDEPLILPTLDSPAAILAALSQLTLAIAANGIDLKRANILLRALTLATRLTANVARAAAVQQQQEQQQQEQQHEEAQRQAAPTEAPEPPAEAPASPRVIPQIHTASPIKIPNRNRLPRSQRNSTYLRTAS